MTGPAEAVSCHRAVLALGEDRAHQVVLRHVAADGSVAPANPPSLADVASYARARLLPYKVPKSIEIVEEMPRSAVTKVNRRRLVEVRGG